MPDGAALIRPTKPTISATYTESVGPVSAAPPGIRGTALMQTPGIMVTYCSPVF